MSINPSNDEIQARAYERFLDRGGEPGHDVEDWLAAEIELTQKHKRASAIYEHQDEEERPKLGYAATAGRKK